MLFRSFRRRYEIPDEIGLELVEADDFSMEETAKGMPFPVIAIVEGGLRFPLSPFLHKFIVKANVCPSQLSSNVYRIINGMLELNRRLGTNLGHAELDYCYTLCNVGRVRYT